MSNTACISLSRRVRLEHFHSIKQKTLDILQGYAGYHVQLLTLYIVNYMRLTLMRIVCLCPQLHLKWGVHLWVESSLKILLMTLRMNCHKCIDFYFAEILFIYSNLNRIFSVRYVVPYHLNCPLSLSHLKNITIDPLSLFIILFYDNRFYEPPRRFFILLFNNIFFAIPATFL